MTWKIQIGANARPSSRSMRMRYFEVIYKSHDRQNTEWDEKKKKEKKKKTLSTVQT